MSNTESRVILQMRIILTANGSRRVEGDDAPREKKGKEVLVVLDLHPVYFLGLEILKGIIEILSKHVYEHHCLCILNFTKLNRSFIWSELASYWLTEIGLASKRGAIAI